MSREPRFSTSLRGYSVTEVDAFVTRVTEQVAALEEERTDLESELERARSELERARAELQEARDSLGDYRSAATRYVERVRALESLIALGAREIAERMRVEPPVPPPRADEPPEASSVMDTHVMDTVEMPDEIPSESEAPDGIDDYSGEPSGEPTNEEDAVG